MKTIQSAKADKSSLITAVTILSFILFALPCFALEQTDIPAAKISAGFYHTVGLKSDGTVVAVGLNDWGQLDVGTWTNIVQVSGGSHTVGLKSDGTVVAVGYNYYLQCYVSDWTDIVQVSAGNYHTVGLKSDGTVVAIGWNDYGQCDVGDWEDIVQASAGERHTVGLKSDGTVVTVGWNGYGQLNVNSWTDIAQVSAGDYHTIGLKSDGTVVAVGSNGNGQCDTTPANGFTDIVQISAGTYHTIGLKSDGTVVACGYNDYGQRDVNGWTDIVQVSGGYRHTVGLRSDGTIVACGDNYYGQLDGGNWMDIVQISAGTYHTAGLKSDGTVVTVGWNGYGQLNVNSWTDIAQVSAGDYHTVGLKSNGTVVAVGWNDDGQCEVDPILYPEWTDIAQVSAGELHTVGLKSDGTVVAVGSNGSGQCDTTPANGFTDIVQISAGTYHTAGLKSDGTVVACGYNDYGQCDVGTWTNIVRVSGGHHCTVGLKSDGTVVAVGYNNYGQCDVSGWTDIVQVSAGGLHTVGLKSDGTVAAIGWNDYGQCDVSGWEDIAQVSASGLHTVGLKSNGTVVAVGENGFGRLDVGSWMLGVPAPAANFTASSTAGNAPLTVNFTDISSGNITSWSWDFGDPASGANNTSTLQDPSHIYNDVGIYSISLTATGSGGSDTETKTDYIDTIGNPPPVPPTISNISVTGITTTGAIINWDTDEPATSQVEYGIGTDYGNMTTLGLALTTSHSVQLTGLLPLTTYHFRVLSKGAAADNSQSDDWTFTTGGPGPGQGPSLVYVNGTQLMVGKRNPDGTLQPAAPYIIRGVNWSPADSNTATSPADPQNTAKRRPEFGDWYGTDIPLMQAMNVNTVRTYMDFGFDETLGPIGLAVLDELYQNGIMVIMTVDDAINDLVRVEGAVNYYKDHPAILMWSLGNEWNINHYYRYGSWTISYCAQQTEVAAALVKSLDANHPVVSSYGEIDIPSWSEHRLLDTQNYVNNICTSADVWGLNLYRGNTFGTVFDQWESISTKPIFIGEFGADAYDIGLGDVNETAQADWDVSLCDDILRHLSAKDPADIALGGTVFEWNDEWWKVSPWNTHDIGGWNNPAGFPDGMGNEEYFGIVDIDRNVREVHDKLAIVFHPDYNPPPLPPQTKTFRADSEGYDVVGGYWWDGGVRFYKDGQVFYTKGGGSGGGRGFNIAVIDAATGDIIDPGQNFERSQSEQSRMIDFINSIPDGMLLMIAAADDAGLTNSSCTFLGYAEPVLQALEALGSTEIRNYCFRYSWAMIAIKGDGQALAEAISPSRLEAVSVEADITVNYPPPVADFTASPTSGDVPLTVNFTDLSSGTIDTWSWAFGDGGTDTVQNPTHVYTAAGTYTVTLTATGPGGSDGEIKTDYVTVTVPIPAPVADFTSDVTAGQAPLTTNFTDTSTGAVTSRSWVFGDGGTDTAQNPIHTYTAAGTYTVTLTVSGPGGSDIESKIDYMTVTGSALPPVKIGSVYKYTLQEGYDFAGEGDIIQSQDFVFSEDLLVNIDKSVTLRCGYDSGFIDNTDGVTTLNGDMTIDNGKLIIDSGTLRIE